MIPRRARFQLVAFVLVTALGFAWVGTQYAHLERAFLDTTYTVRVDFQNASGAFPGSKVTYRGVTVGRVDTIEVADSGVQAVLQMDRSGPDIPSDLLAVVANGSAIGEQYVDLQPQTDEGPWLEDGTEIVEADTRLPVSTEDLIANTSDFVSSVDPRTLRTVVSELGTAFKGSGRDLSTILDSSGAFIKAANKNFAATAALIRDSRTVLATQVDSREDISSWARDLADFTDTLAESDGDLRTVVDDAPETFRQLQALIGENTERFGDLIDNLQVVNDVTQARLPEIRGVLALAPYALEAGYSVLVEDDDGNYSIALTFATSPKPLYCLDGYTPTDAYADPESTDPVPFDTSLGCGEPADQTNPRGLQNALPAAALPSLGTYDAESQTFAPAEAVTSPTSADSSTVTSASDDEDSWKWLLTGATAP